MEFYYASVRIWPTLAQPIEVAVASMIKGLGTDRLVWKTERKDFEVYLSACRKF